jgi:hypothetical protein
MSMKMNKNVLGERYEFNDPLKIKAKILLPVSLDGLPDCLHVPGA